MDAPNNQPSEKVYAFIEAASKLTPIELAAAMCSIIEAAPALAVLMEIAVKARCEKEALKISPCVGGMC